VSEDGNDSKGEYPPAPAGWFSGSGLRSAGYKQSSTTINRKLAELRRDLINDTHAAGIRRDIAAEIIEQHLIGKKRSARGPAALHASPEAIALLERDGILTHKWDNGILENPDKGRGSGVSR
jgi:hypothetical protein